jgi:hypothetical protein
MIFGASNSIASSALTRVINITSNVNDYNLYNELIATGWNGTKRLKVFVTINSGVTVGSTSTLTPAFLVSALRDTDFVQITNNGNIFGAGGAGGDSFANSNGASGSPGGTALRTLSNIRVVNNGIIGGGGGGGGGAGASRALVSYTPSCLPNRTYQAGYFTCGRCINVQLYIFNEPATCTPNYSYPAGAAGAAGTAGSGVAGAVGASPWYTGGDGGATGNYYQGSSKITVITAGTVRGGIVV